VHFTIGSGKRGTEVAGKTGVFSGFKEFLMRGNVVELAVAVVVGAAFTKIVDAVVTGVINPLIGTLGSQNLDRYRSCLSSSCSINGKGEVTGVYIQWGSVLSAALTFLLTAAVVYFLMIMPMSRFNSFRKRKEPEAEPELPPTEVELLAEIRDLLAQRGSATSLEKPSVPGPSQP
jgi:large conductance mechanosensitive channel